MSVTDVDLKVCHTSTGCSKELQVPAPQALEMNIQLPLVQYLSKMIDC